MPSATNCRQLAPGSATPNVPSGADQLGRAEPSTAASATRLQTGRQPIAGRGMRSVNQRGNSQASAAADQGQQAPIAAEPRPHARSVPGYADFPGQRIGK